MISALEGLFDFMEKIEHVCGRRPAVPLRHRDLRPRRSKEEVEISGTTRGQRAGLLARHCRVDTKFSRMHIVLDHSLDIEGHSGRTINSLGYSPAEELTSCNPK